MTTSTAASQFTAADSEQMSSLGISPEEAERQLALFRDPPAPVRLDRPATVGDGIVRLSDDEAGRLEERAAVAAEAGEMAKFVPASGAASRMFRRLEAAQRRESRDRRSLVRAAEEGDEPAEAALRFLERLDDFAFGDDLAAALERAGRDLRELRRRGEVGTILDHLLGEAEGHGLGYAPAPKGLIPFHRYPDGSRRTAFEEHLVEAADHVRDARDVCRLHFTVAPEHREGFERLLAEARERLAERLGARFEVEFSHQSHATDTLAVDPEDRPFRLADGRLLFRPGGHGALIGNLGSVAAPVVFVKNVDNVVPEGDQGPVVRWKNRLGGKLLELRDGVFEHLGRLEEGSADEGAVEAAAELAARELGRGLPARLSGAPAEERRRALIDLLDRPLRVCGVVENVGEPGGGPFWVEGPEGELSLQIVEASQVDPDDPAQQDVLGSATHFNPVDLVCSLADRHGRRYDLERFVDPSTVFIAGKSHEGRKLKALERPGLWNGAMAGWNTVFVEMPLATFAPVKTVFDLLRPAHQAG